MLDIVYGYSILEIALVMMVTVGMGFRRPQVDLFFALARILFILTVVRAV